MTSPIDQLFEKIFGHSPSKSGTAFEQLAAIATHIIRGGDVKHDDKLRGEFSKTLYQLDVHHRSDNVTVMGEAKDYTQRKKNSKVGRGDLQKLGGALPDLKDIDEGSFFSATGYTKPAQKYAEKAVEITGKPITLYGFRPSTKADEKGYLKTIVVRVDTITSLPQESQWTPHITHAGKEALKVLQKDGEEKIELNFKLSFFYDREGREKLSLNNLISDGYGEIHQETRKSHGCFILEDYYININGVLVEVKGLEYQIAYSCNTQEIRISDDLVKQ